MFRNPNKKEKVASGAKYALSVHAMRLKPPRQPRAKRPKKTKPPPPAIIESIPDPDSLTDEQLMESWTVSLRNRAEDLYYSRKSWETLATIAVALMFGLILCWALVRCS